MRNSLVMMLIVLTAAFFIIPNAGCWIMFPDLFPAPGGTTDDGTDDGTTDGTDDSTDDGTDNGTDDGTDNFTIVKTDIEVRHDAALKTGTDLIAYGTAAGGSTIVGVSYIIPSESPTTGTAVPDTELYSNKAFAVGGRTIFLVGSNTGALAFQVSVYDVDTAAITQTFATDDIRLGSIPVGADDAGHIQADGDYCVVICDQSTVADGLIVKVIDVSGAAPALIAFSENPAASHFQVDQVAVNAASQTAVAVADDTFFIYDITDPTAAPTEIVSPNGVSDTQIQMNGCYIIALDDQAYPHAILVDLATNNIIDLTDAFGIADVAIGTEVFAFFADADANDSSGGSQRAAVGTVPGPGYTKAALDQYIDGSTANNGLVGFAGSLDVVPDDSYVFLADAYLQYSAGGATFTVPEDPDAEDTYGCPAWDVDCSAGTVGFKTATTRSDTTATTVGYIILP